MEKLAQEEREAELRAKEEFLSGEQDTGRLDRLIEIIERSI